MKKVLVSLFCGLLAINANASILTEILPAQKKLIESSKIGTEGVFVDPNGIEMIFDHIVEKAKEKGIIVRKATPDTFPRIQLTGSVFTNFEGRKIQVKNEKFLTSDKYLSAATIIPDKQALLQGRVGAANSVFNVDGGIIEQGARATGSESGGVLVGLAVNGLSMLVGQSAFDKQPGSVAVKATVLGNGEAKSFGFGVKSTEEITPKELIVAGYVRAIEMLHESARNSAQEVINEAKE